MKRMFIAAMAIAALVSCSKDDSAQGPALDSKNKTVEITIANAVSGSRVDGGITAPGAADEGQTNQMKSAEADDLWVLFAAGDNVVMAKKLTATGTTDETHTTDFTAQYVADKNNGTGEGTYKWHNVPWNVTNIAVVRTSSADTEFYQAAGVDKKTITDYQTLAKDETANLTRSLDDIVLFGTDVLKDMNETHEVEGVSYHYWSANVEVKPWVARFEINQIKCKDLGYLNTAEEGDNRTYGFDELVANSLTWKSVAGTSYTAKYETGTTLGTMYGQYNNTTATNNTNPDPATRYNYIKPANGNVWSWNVADKVTFDEMTVDLKATAYDYTLQEAGQNVPLVVIGLDGTDANYEFKMGNIYQLDLTFEEGNVKDQDALCVVVNVTIANWVINTLTPTFQTNPATSEE